MPLRSDLLRIASELPRGNPTRREILSALTKRAYNEDDVNREIQSNLESVLLVDVVDYITTALKKAGFTEAVPGFHGWEWNVPLKGYVSTRFQGDWNYGYGDTTPVVVVEGDTRLLYFRQGGHEFGIRLGAYGQVYEVDWDRKDVNFKKHGAMTLYLWDKTTHEELEVEERGRNADQKLAAKLVKRLREWLA